MLVGLEVESGGFSTRKERVLWSTCCASDQFLQKEQEEFESGSQEDTVHARQHFFYNFLKRLRQ